ncbi:putative neogenin isoform X2 [Apostichopus japonicus]|uniref:Putative neogenin isoform X2 n=1 Tax=Stichopus japonicus TaxID=307972 RepID=A0A2G8K286_STIJA|nr:putative neogenin isoform X2 [Apostichopus japonicus]
MEKQRLFSAVCGMFMTVYLYHKQYINNAGRICVSVNTQVAATSFLDFSFDREPSDTVVASGDTVTLECSVTSTSNPTIEWYKDGVRISNTGVRFSELSDGSLRVGPSNNIAGSYSCSVEDRASNLLLVSREAVVSIATLELISHPVDVTDLYAGDTARFECLAQGQGPLEYVWQRDRANIDLTEERVAARYSLLPSGTLEIQDIRFEDEGSYRCRVISPYGGMQELSREAELVLRRGSASSSRVFEFATEPQSNILLKIGSPVILEVSTTQPAIFRWFKDDAELSFPGDHYSLVGQGSLFIEELQEIHTAIYKVVAESLDGTLIESRTSVLALARKKAVMKRANILNHCKAGRYPLPLCIIANILSIPVLTVEVFFATSKTLILYRLFDMPRNDDRSCFQFEPSTTPRETKLTHEWVLRISIPIP